MKTGFRNTNQSILQENQAPVGFGLKKKHKSVSKDIKSHFFYYKRLRRLPKNEKINLDRPENYFCTRFRVFSIFRDKKNNLATIEGRGVHS